MNQKQQTILIVNDSIEDREIYRRYLSQDSIYQYEILEAKNGTDGLEFSQQVQPDAILLEFKLPDFNGLEFLDKLKQRTGRNKLPVVMITGGGDEAIAVAAIKNGADDYLVKKSTTAECLCRSIRNAIERENLQRQLAASERRYYTSVENMLDCFGIYSSIRDESGKIVDFMVEYVNGAACENNRMTAEEQIGKKLCELLPAHRETGLFEEYCKVVETGEPLYKEAVIYADNYGKQYLTRAFDIRVAKLNDGFVATWRDITARKQTETALEESQQFMQQIANATPGIVYLHDLIDQRNLYINAKISELLGYTPEEIVEMGAEFTPQVMHPDDFARLPAHMEKFKVAKDEEIVSFEYRMRHKNGEWRWFQSQDTVFMRTAEGLPSQIIGSAQDITERKQVEAELIKVNQRFELAASAVKCLIYDVDVENNIVEISGALTEILGFDAAEIEPTREWWHNRIHPEDLARMESYVSSILATRDRCTIEYRVRHKNNRYVYVLDHLLMIRDRAGNLVRVVGTALNISERKRAEAAVSQSEERYRSLVTATSAIVWHADRNGQMVFSPTWEVFTGQTIAEYTGWGWQEVIHPDDRQKVVENWAKAIEEKKLYEMEYRLRHRDGRYRYVWERSLPILNADNSVREWIGMVTDISDRKADRGEIQRLNRELERRINELQTLFEVLPVGIAIAQDPDCKDIRANPFLQQILNVSPNENVSATKPNPETLPYKVLRDGKEIPGEELPMQVTAASGKEIRDFELQVLHLDGTIFDLLGNASPLFDEQGKVRGCVGIFLDISDRKSSELAMRQSEERYRNLADIIPQFVWTCDATGKTDYVNQRWCDYTGLTLEETLADAWEKDIFHPDDFQVCVESWQQAIESGTIFETEVRFKRASDRQYRWFLLRAFPIKDEQNRISKWFGTSTDINDQKQIETERAHLLELEQAAREQAEAANRAKDDFVSMVSHDLRAPLNSILGWIQLLRTRKFNDEAKERALETIERNARSQAKLLEDLLDVSRMIQGKLQINAYNIELIPIIETAINTAYPVASAKKIHLESSIDPFIRIISGDPNRLQQILANLLTNAIKFTPENGIIKISLRRVDKFAKISVSDTGQGISPEFLPYVFDRFRQDGSASKSKEGLGLGLAIAHHLVTLHGGTIEAHSDGIGQGATFIVKLPLIE